MPNYSDPIDILFNALAEPARRRMVERLAEGPCSVSGLAEVVPISLPAILQHLGVLEAAGVIASQKVGRVRTVSLKPGALKGLESWAANQARPWERKLDHLDAYLKQGKD